MSEFRGPVACSWSGGKDSCLAWYRSCWRGGETRALLTMLDADGARSRSHGLRPEVLTAQAEALGLPLRTGCASWADYETEFKACLRGLREAGIEDVVFGDIDLADHREWEERVCRETGVVAHLPLWQEDRRRLVEEFLDAGFRARIVAVQLEALSREFLGAELDASFLRTCESLGVDACGENGEFHTVVCDGPGFGAAVPLQQGEVSVHGGYAFVDFTVG